MRGSEQYHAMKSLMAKPYARCDWGEPKVFKTESFAWSVYAFRLQLFYSSEWNFPGDVAGADVDSD
jgi:hypothetical protein